MEVGGKFPKPTFKILSDNLAVQGIHAQFGGVFPMMAKKEHVQNLPILLEQALKKTKLDKKKKPVDMIAVTYGPGLEPCLWTGITFAEDLGKKWGVPVIPTNHMEGHILSVYAKNKGKFSIPKIEFPVVSLLVSGGHTELILSKEILKYKMLGHTRDDAAGEAFDKVARMMDIPYPGGPKISKLAQEERDRHINGGKFQGIKVTLPRPMMYSKDLDFSFAGLKTAVLYTIKKINPLTDEHKSAIALEFENAVVETLIHKTKKAVELHKAKTVIVSGGVAANQHLRTEIKKAFGKKAKVFFPTRELARDNALMIGVAGFMQYLKKKGKLPKNKKIKACGNLKL